MSDPGVEDMIEHILSTIDGTVFREADGNALILTADDNTIISVTGGPFFRGDAATSSAEGLQWGTGWTA